MKYIKNELHLNKKGVTVVEMVVVTLLIVLVLGVGYLIFTTMLSSTEKTLQRADVQSQFRLVADIFDREVGTATYVQLTTMGGIISGGDSFTYFYVKSIGGGKSSLFKRVGSTETAYTTPYPLDNFRCVFQKSGTSDKIINYFMEADGAESQSGSILLQNTSVQNTSGDQMEVIKITPLWFWTKGALIFIGGIWKLK